MKQKVKEFLVNFEPNAKKHKYQLDWRGNEHIKYLGKSMCEIDGTPVFIKSGNYHGLVFGKASSEMYNKIGIPTPRNILLRDTDSNELYTASQDITLLNDEDMEIVCAHFAPEIQHLKKDFTKIKVDNKWSILYNEEEKQKFLQHMTESCFDDIICILLLDELRTDPDRHWRNYFLYRKKGATKYEGVIPIDLEFAYFTSREFDAFKDYDKYQTYSIYSCRDNNKSYSTRIFNILSLIQDNQLTPQQTSTLKKALAFDFGKCFCKTAKECDMIRFQSTQAKADFIKQQWEYLNNTLGKEL